MELPVPAAAEGLGLLVLWLGAAYAGAPPAALSASELDVPTQAGDSDSGRSSPEQQYHLLHTLNANSSI